MAVTLTINGETHEIDAPAGTPLLWVLRDHLGLTGTKFGCGIAQCGACTVHLNGNPIRSCIMPVSAIGDGKITTVEGVESKAAMAIRKAWRDIDVVQCGYCQSGQMMSATALLESNPNPSDDDIDTAMHGNLCRCATYHRIRAAIHRAADELEV
ncbi:MAG: (2Fe-2S)-binding protein [Pseudomonadota bacterium]